MHRRTHFLALKVSFASLAVGLLCGCSGSFAPTPVADYQTPLGEIHGSVHGGNAPVTGAQVYVLATGTGGYGTASTSLIPTSKNGVNGVSCTGGVNGDCYSTTDQYGNFSIGTDYNCTLGQQVYIVAVGGNPGMGGTVNNTAIVQMAGLGSCPASGSMAQQVPYLVINEITTVGFAYAMGGFAADAFHIAGSGSALSNTGIANAMANSENILGIGWGGALANANGNSNSVAPESKINSLADIVATCVNTSSATSSTCSTLFANAKNASGTTPTDETTALFNIVHNPGNNASALWSLFPAQPVFSPALSAAPADWTMPVIYNSVAGKASSMAVDASGNTWISDSTNKAVVRISAQGAVATYTNGGNFGAIAGVAVNPVTAKIWASDPTNNKVYILDSTGSLLTTITTGSLNKPAGIAFDKLGNGYVTNTGAYVIGEYNSGGTLIQTASYPSSQGYTSGIAVDYSGNVYTAGGSGNAGVGVLMAGSTTSQYYGNGSSGGSSYLALDATSNVPVSQAQYWTAENNVWTMTSSGVGERYYLFSTGYAFGGIVQGTYIGWMGGIQPTTTPSSIALDGAGNVWIANATPVTVSWGPTSGLTGLTVTGTSYAAAGMDSNAFAADTASGVGAYTAVPDSAGNVWVANTDGTVSQMLGLATPVVTPLVPGKFATTP
jgi:hypothetical protein